MARVRTLQQAALWVDTVGLALVFPKPDVVLPSLWEQVNGSPERNWAIRFDDGTFVSWSKEMGFLWRAKDALPEQGLVCVGKHVARVATCVAPRLLPTLVAAHGGSELGENEVLVVEAVRDSGPLTGPELREHLGGSKREIDKAVASLHRSLLLTNALLVEQGGPWGAIAHDLLARKWQLGADLPDRDEARRELGRLLLNSVGELTAADLAGPFGWRRKEAESVLDEIAEGRDAGGFRIWARP